MNKLKDQFKQDIFDGVEDVEMVFVFANHAVVIIIKELPRSSANTDYSLIKIGF